MRTRLPTSRSVTHPRIALGQARLTLEFFSNELPEKKLQLVGMGFLSILLSHAPGSHTGASSVNPSWNPQALHSIEQYEGRRTPQSARSGWTSSSAARTTFA